MSDCTPLQPLLPTKTGERRSWGRLHGASASLAIISAAQQRQQLIVIVTANTATANELERELIFFRHSQQDLPILTFPDWEILPYDHFSPHQDIISQRLLTLYQLPNLHSGILIVSANTLMHRILPREYLEGNSFILNCGDTLDLEQFRQKLTYGGYRAVSQVMEHGEYTVRGSIIDIFPMGSELPLRIDLLDDEIDTIRTFDTDTQRTINTIPHFHLLPAREFPLTEDAITRFRKNWRTCFPGNPADSTTYKSISQGESATGVEYYLPLFFDKTSTLLDYLPNDCLLIRMGELDTIVNQFWQEITSRYEQLRYDIQRPILSPQEVFLNVDQLFGAVKPFSTIHIQSEALPEKVGYLNFTTGFPPQLTVDNSAKQPLHTLHNWLTAHTGRVLFTAETAGRREVLLELLDNIAVKPTIYENWQTFLNSSSVIGITVGDLERGMNLIQPNIALIAETQLFGQQVMQRRLRKRRDYDTDAIVRDLSELKIGSPVVHIDHGVGRYIGLQIIKTGEQETEYLTLEYANNTKLYVPVAALHLISRYSGTNPDHAPVNRLGSGHWEKAKRKAAEKVRDVAAELLDIYARRAAKSGFQFAKPDHHYIAFSSAFPFEETPDQLQAINYVIDDMTSSRCMDRLVCGDVGFGKTEVAIRAAFVAIQGGKQVALLVPTTLLAEQHLHSFQDRFAQWPVRIEALSRFRNKKDQEKIITELEEGKVDIVIGTHKLLQSAIRFKALGLLVVDEEHRFGVNQKERIKAMRAEVDLLTLTATPIPRTLNMALANIRDLSIIATPPARRLSVKTFVREYDKSLIREAVLREILRGGQVYFLYNDVQTISKVQQELLELIPEARIGIGHGQMPERELEKVMSDFYHQRFNLLICTTIIESGIDIPTANTIIINRADRFGLAQLHQLRGRVGRSHHQAYAYLLTPPPKAMTADAVKRLDAIASLEDLGAGFTLATHDLEIRGAGELLGDEQSGHIQEIGFSLYMELLEQTVNALKAGKEPNLQQPLQQGVEINLYVSALLPDTYISDVHTRLIMYKRIANSKNQAALYELQVELVDRFGLLPPAIHNLFAVANLKLKAEPLSIHKMDVSNEGGFIEFYPQPNIDVMALIKLVQIKPKEYQLIGNERLRFKHTFMDTDAKIKFIEALLHKISKS